MIKNTVITLTIVFLAAFAYAADHEGGRQIWKKNCRIACHDGSTSGSPEISPSSKTQVQWKNSFADNREYILKFHKPEDIAALSEREWDAVYDFVYHHAYDSDNPEDCMGNAGALVR